MTGSSPRVWGIRDQLMRPRALIRFIPTCVGNTSVSLPRRSEICGSSPRVWGIRRLYWRTWRRDAVHPHVCGEYSRSGAIPSPAPPVHPHVCGEYVIFARWITPISPVHPHVCGEYDPHCLKKNGTSGSSPRVWGIPTAIPLAQNNPYGSSPRVWGIPIAFASRCPPPPVHPHVCGEYKSRKFWTAAVARFIPTCVGNTCSRSFCEVINIGSSPRVWGIPFASSLKIRRFGGF